MDSDQKDNHWQGEQDEDARETTQADEIEEPTETEQSKKSHKNSGPVTNWIAAEYLHMEKGALWYAIFTIIVLVLVALDILLLKTWTLSALVVVMAIAVIIYSRRPPAEIQYSLSPHQGIYVGEQLYPFSQFKAFGVIRDGEHHFIKFIPVKRLSPGLSIYFPEEAGEEIVDTLGTQLPMENLKLDLVDVIVRSIRL
jgi:hypothetical protein